MDIQLDCSSFGKVVGLGFSYYYHLEMVAAAYIYKYTLLWQARKELENLTYVDDVHIIRY